MTITFRRILIGCAIHSALGPGALAVMPPSTSYLGAQDTACAKSSDTPQQVSNQDVLRALMENQKLLQELLRRMQPQSQGGK